MPTRLTKEIIAAAILGFEEQKRHIDIQIAELRAALSGSTAALAATPEAPKGKRRRMSAAARKRIGDAQRKRWAESKGESVSPSETFAARAKRKMMSAAGRKAISEATKKRWAAFHAAKGKEKPAIAAKKAAVKKAPMKTVAMKAPAVRKTAKTALAATQTAAQ